MDEEIDEMYEYSGINTSSDAVFLPNDCIKKEKKLGDDVGIDVFLKEASEYRDDP
jgi:hypothetical protein